MLPTTTANLNSYTAAVYVCRRTSARRARAESLPDVLSMDDAGAVALRANESSSSSSSSKVFKSIPRVCVCVERVPRLCCGNCSGLSTYSYCLVQPSFISHVHLEQKRIFSVTSYDLQKWICRFCEWPKKPN